MRAIQWLGLLWLAGCTGKVGDAQPLPDPTKPSLPTNPDGTPVVVDLCVGAPRDPGRVTLHRLNRAEYDNTVRDLIDTAQRPARDFPSDDHGYGFDNIADVLSMSPLLVEKYQLAAEALTTEIFASPFTGPTTQQAEAEVLTGSAGGESGEYWNLFSNGEVVYRFNADLAGRYEVSTRLYGQQAGPDPAQAEVTLDGASLGVFDVAETSANPRTITVSAQLTPGMHTLSVAFLNDYYLDPDDRNLLVD